MTLWEAYLIFLSRLGLGPRPVGPDGAPLELPSLNSAGGSSPQATAVMVTARTTGTMTTPASAQLEQLARFKGWPWVGLPVAAAMAVLGQWGMLQNRSEPLLGVIFLVLGTILFVLTAWLGDLDVRAAEPKVETPVPETLPLLDLVAPAQVAETRVRWRLVGMALLWSGLAYFATGGNNFSLLGRLSWGLSLLAWIASFWQGPLRLNLNWREAFNRLWRGQINIRLTRTLFALLVILAISASFRFAQLDEAPIEMTSDHVEKLIDVNDILNNGLRPVFEPGNGGREAMEFYLAAVAANYFGLGLSHLTLKVVTSLVGFFTLPIIFLLVREMTDDVLLALLATLAAGIGWWPNVISRNGLRFPFAPFFGALALWLIVRAIKRDSRNSALFAGLALGVGLYGYTPFRVVPVAVIVALGLYALHRRDKSLAIKLAKWWAMLTLVMVAGFVPMIRYAMDDPRMFLERSLTRFVGDPGAEVPPTLGAFITNEWQSLLMFSWTTDAAWLVSPADQPALDWIMAGLFALGIGFLAYRYVRRRDWLDLFLMISIPVLLLPSTLALAFPLENPSLHRSGAAIPIVFAVVAIPLRLLIAYGKKLFEGKRGTLIGAGLAGVIMFLSWQINWNIVFVKYAGQYKDSVQNASELGRLVRAWADSVGTYDAAAVRAYPYWVDTRAVGIYATGDLTWNNAILNPEELDDWVNDPRPKLYILNRHDSESIAALRQLYPQGKLAYHPSSFHDKDYLTFFVPGSEDFDEATLQQP